MGYLHKIVSGMDFEGKEGAVEGGILRDQLADLRTCLFISMPISTALSALILAVEILSGNTVPALIWFAAANVINAARIVLALQTQSAILNRRSCLNRLRLYEVLALLSGFTWAGLAVLTHGYTSSQSSIHMIILAGISAGAVTYSGSRALVAINFFAPPLLVAFGCVAAKGDMGNGILAFSILIFIAGMVRSSLIGQSRFRETSRLKYEARQFASEMEANSNHDPLTGLLNRRGLEQAVCQMDVSQGPFVTMLIDLDGFKAVNDTYGHKVGDELLQSIARSIESKNPRGATLARVGGDEFVLVFPSNCDAADAAAAAIISAVANQHAMLNSVQIGASIGIYLSENLDLSEMLPRADAALYSAKRAGRKEYRFFDDSLHRELERKHGIERDLQSAIDNGSLSTWFQPIMRMDANTIIGFEALLRWDHPVHGLVAPPDIVTAARENGLLHLLTETVFRNCCDMIEALQADGRPDIRVAMNLSPRELEAGNVDKLILDGLEARNLPPDMLEIEITEDAPVNHERVDEKLGRLSDAGITIVLDDFGTGFSTLAGLKDGRIRKIKIDKDFVRDLAKSLEDQAVVKAVIDLGRTLGREVMAEGVETDADRRILQALGCTIAQGYFFSKALPMEEALDLDPRQVAESSLIRMSFA